MRIDELDPQSKPDKRSEKMPFEYNEYGKHLEAIQRDCSQAYAAKRFLFKGIAGLGQGIYKTDPAKVKRKSANTTNYYTVLFDNLPSWKNYPKRSRSLICTNNPYSGIGFGKIYMVVPFDNAKFGICPTADLWTSFDSHAQIANLSKFTGTLSRYFKCPASYDILISKIFRYKKQIVEYFNNFDFTNYAGFWQNFKIAKNEQQCADILNDMFDPSKNGFMLVNVSNLPNYFSSRSSHEIWTDRKAYLISDDMPIFAILKDELKVHKNR